MDVRRQRELDYICNKYNKTNEQMIAALIRRRYEDIMTGVEII